MMLQTIARSRAGQFAILGALAFVLLAVRFSPDWFAFAEVAQRAAAGASDLRERRVIEQQVYSRYAERGYYVLRQAEDLQAEIDEPRHKIVRWRLLVPVIGRALMLPGWMVLGLAHVGCLVLVFLLLHLGMRATKADLEGAGHPHPACEAFWFALIAGAGAPFFASMGWLGYYDSWLAIAFLAVGYGRSRAVVLAACVLAPWIDERFVIGLPLALWARWLQRKGDAPALRAWAWREAAPALLVVGLYALVRLRLGGSGGSQSMGEYLQRFVLDQETTLVDRLRGAWEGLRFAWVVVAAALAVAWRSRERGLLVGFLLMATTALVGVYTAQDISRSMVLLVGVVPLAWQRAVGQAWWMRLRAGPVLGVLAVALPATHVVSEHRIAVEAFWRTPDQLVAAANNLGVTYAQGLGVKADIHAAVHWYTLAAEAGDATAASNLGRLYASDPRLAANYTEALRWYRLAAEGGNPNGMASLGIMYAEGLGVPADRAEALRWYRRGAEAGDPVAQNNLASAYQQGDGVPRDARAARDWYQRAAGQGFAPAQLHLGRLLAGDDASIRDLVESWVWLSVCADSGNVEAAQLRQLVQMHLTQAELAEAQRRVAEWKRARLHLGHSLVSRPASEAP